MVAMGAETFLTRVMLRCVRFFLWFVLQNLACIARAFGLGAQWLESANEWVVGLKAVAERSAAKWVDDYLTEKDEDVDFVHVKRGKGRKPFTKRLAREAYHHFGPRKLNDANRIVTRKWMVRWVEENTNTMRIADKISVVDGALFLSFIPSDIYMQCETFTQSETYSDLVPSGADQK